MEGWVEAAAADEVYYTMNTLLTVMQTAFVKWNLRKDHNLEAVCTTFCADISCDSCQSRRCCGAKHVVVDSFGSKDDVPILSFAWDRTTGRRRL